MTPLKTNTFISFIVLFVLLMIPDEAVAQGRRSREAVANSLADTLKADTLRADTLALTPQTKKKQPLDAPVIYSANDSIVFSEGGYAHLYGDGKVNYEKIELGAQIITMNMDSSTVLRVELPTRWALNPENRYLKTAILPMTPKPFATISKVKKDTSTM